MSDCFFVIPYGSVYNDILGRSFLVTLYTLAFTAHLKMKYQSVPNKPNIITTGLRRAWWIHEATLKNPLSTVFVPEKIRKKTHEVTNVVVLDVPEDETLRELDPSTMNKMKTLRLVLDGKFEVIQLDDNLALSVMIGADLPTRVK